MTPAELICPRCGKANPADARFCLECGNGLTDAAPRVGREERKVVSVLFADPSRPQGGEGMAAGDVVNTAARLQAAAPVDGILVDETTWRATSRMIDYRSQDPVTVKGKAEPIAVWEAVSARARFGIDVRQLSQTPPGRPIPRARAGGRRPRPRLGPRASRSW